MFSFHTVISEKQDKQERKNMKNRRSIGFDYEKIAGKYLAEHGYEILEYNFYSRNGEIDIIAKHEGYLVFVEVKYRENDSKGDPLEAVTLQKQRTISRCALYYMSKKGMQDVSVRFDVVGILGDDIQIVQNAFEFTI